MDSNFLPKWWGLVGEDDWNSKFWQMFRLSLNMASAKSNNDGTKTIFLTTVHNKNIYKTTYTPRIHFLITDGSFQI